MTLSRLSAAVSVAVHFGCCGRRAPHGSPGRRRAVLAAAVERQVVIFHSEALRRQARQVARAGMHVEHTLALPALEVVVMLMSHQFEPWVLAGQVHRLQLAFFDQRFEGAVDRGDAQPGYPCCAASSTSCGRSGRSARVMASRMALRWRVLRSMRQR